MNSSPVNERPLRADTAEKEGPALATKFLRLLGRIILIVVITFGFGWVLNKSAANSNGHSVPAGFGRGMLHGALMPGAMPTLLLGKDVVIYSPNNNGRMYKLGYTVGVNACGTLFFGLLYIRLHRMIT